MDVGSVAACVASVRLVLASAILFGFVAALALQLLAELPTRRDNR